MLRAIVLSLAILIGIGAVIPLATDMAEAGPRRSKKLRKQKRGWKGVRKYSKRWWQLYRAQERRKKARAKNRRALRLRQMRLARARENQTTVPRVAAATTPVPSVMATNSYTPSPAVMPSGDTTPNGWRTANASPAELQFRIDNSAGDQIGSASISVVGPAVSGVSGTKTLGGVATTSLRRDVIDRMIRENGWVVNDYKKEVDGQSVYVVVAQSQARNGAVNQRMFYFTEVDGRIYSVATNSPAQEAERIADESEKVINSLKSRVRPGRAAVKE